MNYKPRHAQQAVTSRKIAAMAGSAAAATALLMASPATASAQSAFLSSGFDINAALAQINQQTRESAWGVRVALVAQAQAALPAAQAAQAVAMIDGAVNGLFPGLIEEMTPAPAPAPAPEPEPAPVEAAPAFDRGSCPDWAEACMDINGGRAWLQSGGQVTYVAPASAGAPAPDTATPTGAFKVQYKVKDEVSRQFNNAPMPNSVYFTPNGHAFHAGAVGVLSHGCIHLNYADSAVFFNTLQPGDDVYIY